jgi:hypothetical protein
VALTASKAWASADTFSLSTFGISIGAQAA